MGAVPCQWPMEAVVAPMEAVVAPMEAVVVGVVVVAAVAAEEVAAA